MEQDRCAYYSTFVSAVDAAVALISSLSTNDCFDVALLENEVIPSLGLNNEILEEQPPELGKYFGTGLHLWQYPSQLARYLVWLSYNARHVRRYMEIGCRWGGTFIVVTEWLKKIGAPLEHAVAVDPTKPTPCIRHYQNNSATPIRYIEDYSSSLECSDQIQTINPDMVFIDGDHSIEGVMADHLLVRNRASIIVHHDIQSSACPGTTVFWKYAKQTETAYEAFEFTQQYPSVQGNFLGIGVLSLKER